MSSLQKLKIRTSSVNTTSLLIVVVILSLIISGPQTLHSVQGQPRQMSLNPQSVPIKKVHAGDIDIAYKAFGNGKPVVLIGGVPSVMDFWPSSLLQELATNHTVIIFDNRGVGNTTAGTNPFSIQQFANDTAGLLAALKIQKADVLGFSMGSSIAQELALLHPEMVNKLVLYGASCGGREGIPPNPQIMKLGQKVLFNPNFSSSILRNPTNQTVEFLPLLIPQKWITENPDFITKFFTFIRTLKEVDPPTTIAHQIQAEGTWTGVCDQLPKISSPTLVITGTDDVLVPPTNSLNIVQKIPSSWLVQIKGAGHGLVYQYPDQFTKIVKTFLELG